LGVKQAFSSHRRVLGTLVRLARSPILSIALSQPCSASFIAKPASGRPTSGIAGADYGETIEIDPAYLDVTVKRWQDFTGETVTLGARFDEMILKAVA
jgi:hypothetical protein